MNKILTLIAFTLTTNFLMAQGTLDWYDFTGGVSIATDVNNNVYTVSYDYNPAGDIYLRKRTSSGAFIWDASFNQTNASLWEKATWVEVDNAGNIIVTGTLMSGYSSPVNAASIIMKFSPAGVLLWRNVYESSFDGSYTKKLLIDPANNYYVLGLGTGPSGQVTKVKKFDSFGNSLWNYFHTAGGAPLNFKFTPDNYILIAAKTTTGNLMGYAKIDVNGNNIWNLFGVSSPTAGDAAGDASGNTYILHGSSSGSTIKKLAPNGTLTWSTNYNYLNAFRIEVGTDDFPVAVGFPIPGSGGSAFLKTNANGTQLWYNNNADGIHNFLSHAQIRMDQFNNIYLAASILTAQGVCKVNNNGTTAWVTTFPTGTSSSFCIGNDYNIYVVGGTTARLGQTPVLPIATLNLKLFIQGYYNAANIMKPVLVNQSAGSNPLLTDSITVELHTTTSLIASTKTALMVDGSSACNFPSINGSYYIVIKHRHALLTWSANPILLGALPATYDFTTAANKAYGNNMNEVEPGIWALYGGDNNQDENIDLFDFSILDADIYNYAFGYQTTDINGDGNVDILDWLMLQPNINGFVYSIHP